MAFFNPRRTGFARNMYNQLMPARRPMPPQVMPAQPSMGQPQVMPQSPVAAPQVMPAQPSMAQPQVIPQGPSLGQALPAPQMQGQLRQIQPEMNAQMAQFDQVLNSIPEMQQLRQQTSGGLSSQISPEQLEQLRNLNDKVNSNPQLQDLRQQMEQSRAQMLQSNPYPAQQGIGGLQTMTPEQRSMLTSSQPVQEMTPEMKNMFESSYRSMQAQAMGIPTPQGPQSGTMSQPFAMPAPAANMSSPANNTGTPPTIPAMPPNNPSVQGIGSLQQQTSASNPFVAGASPTATNAASSPSTPSGLF